MMISSVFFTGMARILRACSRQDVVEKLFPFRSLRQYVDLVARYKTQEVLDRCFNRCFKRTTGSEGLDDEKHYRLNILLTLKVFGEVHKSARETEG